MARFESPWQPLQRSPARRDIDINAPGFDPREHPENDLCRLLMPLAAAHLQRVTGSTDAAQDAGECTLLAVRGFNPDCGMRFADFFLTRVRQRGADLARNRRPAGIRRKRGPEIPTTRPLGPEEAEREGAGAQNGLWWALSRIDLMPEPLARCLCLAVVMGGCNLRQAARLAGATAKETRNALSAVS